MSASGHTLVTGGAGFIGSHLVERLLTEGEEVAIIDDCSTGRRENLAGIIDHPRLRFFESGISSCPALPELVRGSRQIFHLAAAVGVRLVLQRPVQTLRTNLHETEVLLEAASEHHVPLLLTSTSEVYGKSRQAAFREDDDLLIGPPKFHRWGYACSKLMDEFMAMAYARERGLPVAIARIFNTVGPRQRGDYGMVLPRFIEAAIAGKPLQVYGDGNQTRCFCCVTDTVEALVRLTSFEGARGETFNVGGTEEVKIRDLAALVTTSLGSSSKIEFVSYDHAYGPGFEEMDQRKPCLKKIERAIGFSPKASLREMILLAAGGKEKRP